MMGASCAALLSMALGLGTVACGGDDEDESTAPDAGPEEPVDAGTDTGPPPDAGPPRRIFAKRCSLGCARATPSCKASSNDS